MLDQLETLIGEMSNPLPRRVRWRGWSWGGGGWTEDRRQRWLRYFTEIRGRVEAGDTSFEEEGHHLIRAMDHDGIVGGRWVERAAEVQEALRKLDLAARRR